MYGLAKNVRVVPLVQCASKCVVDVFVCRK